MLPQVLRSPLHSRRSNPTTRTRGLPSHAHEKRSVPLPRRPLQLPAVAPGRLPGNEALATATIPLEAVITAPSERSGLGVGWRRLLLGMGLALGAIGAAQHVVGPASSLAGTVCLASVCCWRRWTAGHHPTRAARLRPSSFPVHRTVGGRASSRPRRAGPRLPPVAAPCDTRRSTCNLRPTGIGWCFWEHRRSTAHIISPRRHFRRASPHCIPRSKPSTLGSAEPHRRESQPPADRLRVGTRCPGSDVWPQRGGTVHSVGRLQSHVTDPAPRSNLALAEWAVSPVGAVPALRDAGYGIGRPLPYSSPQIAPKWQTSPHWRCSICGCSSAASSQKPRRTERLLWSCFRPPAFALPTSKPSTPPVRAMHADLDRLRRQADDGARAGDDVQARTFCSKPSTEVRLPARWSRPIRQELRRIAQQHHATVIDAAPG